MGVHISSANGTIDKVFLYDSVSGYPLVMPGFDDEEEAASFYDFTTSLNIPDLRRLSIKELEDLHKLWWESYKLEVQAAAAQAKLEFDEHFRQGLADGRHV